MNQNTPLQSAKRTKKDEFYTQLADIENELWHYRPHFAGKVVYCNCDDPTASNFYRYFQLNFDYLGLKELVTTCYQSQQHDLFSQHDSESSVGVRYTAAGATPFQLRGDGDFRSPECIDLLKTADIVVTNPPFSLFRQYVAQLIEHGKQFLIIGHQNAITYKDVFPLIRDGKLWLGRGFHRNCAHFIAPAYQDYATDVDHREGMIRVSGVMWFTNLDHPKRHEPMVLYRKYTPDQYPKYDNYDAINVDRTNDIPYDYDGAMGVPITYLHKHSPDQFEIVGMDHEVITGYRGPESSRFYVQGNRKYARVVIRRKGRST